MKKIILISIVVCMSLWSCANSLKVPGSLINGNTAYTFDKEQLLPLVPRDLVIGDLVANNWWEGSYHGRACLIHLLPHDWHVDLIFTGEEK